MHRRINPVELSRTPYTLLSYALGFKADLSSYKSVKKLA